MSISRVRLSSVEYQSLGETLKDVINKKLSLQHQEQEYELQKQIKLQINYIKKYEEKKNMEMFIDEIILVYIEKYISNKSRCGGMLYFNEDNTIYNYNLPKLTINFIVNCLQQIRKDKYHNLRFHKVQKINDSIFSYRVYIEFKEDQEIILNNKSYNNNNLIVGYK
jgi:hypothetical protein